MAKLINFETCSATKTYATRENAIKAAKAKYSDDFDGLRYFVYQLPNGRFMPVFLGESAIQAGAHFHFHVAG